jgi:outer membrane biogenesis lipoprotein LolB
MTSARVRRRLLASSLFLLTACSESGLQNPAQPQIPPVPGKDAGKASREASRRAP